MSSPAPLEPRCQPLGRRRLLLAVLGLALLIAAFHGRACTYGLFMDDYAHYRQLQAADWSLAALTDACRLELVGGIIDLWWLPEVTLRFFRPVAFGLMKVAYTLTGWSPVALHCASLAWHLAACTLLMLLLLRLGIYAPLAWAVAALFAIHPGHVATVQWIAPQTELIVTTLTLAALLCWSRYRGWHAPGCPPPADAGRRRWLLGALACFAIALGCRENAIMLPVVLAAVELCQWLCARRRGDADGDRAAPRGSLWPAGLGFGVIAVGYLALRWHYLHGAALPPRPYVIPPTDPGFLRYVLDKTCYYLLSEFLLVPCVPIGGLPYFRQHPLVFYGLAGLLAALCLWLVWRHRRSVAGVLGAAALLGFMAPVLPAFESPHHLYLPGVGWAILAALLLQTIGRPDGTAQRSPRRGVMWLAVGLTGAVFGLGAYFSSYALDTAQSVEDQVIDEILAAPVPLEDGDTVYIANLPLIAHYVQLGLEQRAGKRVRVVALTWAPRLLGVAGNAELVRIDPRTIEMRVQPERYFGGALGLLISEAGGAIAEPRTGQLIERQDFTVEVLEVDDRGIAALRFTFADPVPRAGVHLFWGSRTRWAWQVPAPEVNDGNRSGSETTGRATAGSRAVPQR